jgi:hypothetical protein
MNNFEVVSEDTGNSDMAKQTLVYYNNSYYIISNNGSEVLIFKSDDSGNIIDWLEVGSAHSTEDAIENFSECLFR